MTEEGYYSLRIKKKTTKRLLFIIFVIVMLLAMICVSIYASKLTEVFPVCAWVRIVGVNADKNDVILVITLNYRNVD